MDETLWFGKPGLLEKMVVPLGTVTQTTDRASNGYRLAGGATRGDRLLHGRRAFTLDYIGLGIDNYNRLAAYHEGHNGPGPFVYINSSQRNLLTRNQSASGAQSFTTEGFLLTPAATAQLTVSFFIPNNFTGPALRPCSIAAVFTAANPVNPKLTLTPASADWVGGIPCVSNRPHSFGFWANGIGSNPVMNIQPTITYKDTLGTTLATVSATPAITGATWRFYKVENAFAPAGSAFMEPSILLDGTTVGDHDGIQVWQPMLNEGSTLDLTWSPGTGVYPVMVSSLDDIAPLWDGTFRTSPRFVFQEVG